VRLTEEEAQRRLATARVARLATTGGDGQPHLVAVTFAVDGDLIYTAVDHKPKKSTNLRRLRNIRENPRVALLADNYSENWDELWWVRVDGWASVDPRAKAAIWRSVAAFASRVRYMLTPVETTIAGFLSSNPCAMSRSCHASPASKSTATKRSHGEMPKPSSPGR